MMVSIEGASRISPGPGYDGDPDLQYRYRCMKVIIAFVLGIGLALLVGGVPLARKFATRLFTGNEVYVVLTRNGQMEVYQNPNAPYVHEDKPLLMIPYDVLESNEYATYYNICWFDAGVLMRCEHSFHRRPENAMHCDKADTPGSMIGKVLEKL